MSYNVYIDGNVSWAVRAGSVEERLMLNEGHQQIMQNAATELEGWCHAALNYGCYPSDYDDTLKPLCIDEPLELYRAVSIPELADIVSSGEVRGGGNGWNGFDRRPWVFFSPAPSETCIHQGADSERTAGFIAASRFVDRSNPTQQEIDGFRSSWRGIRADIHDWNEGARFTSAVIRTAPVAMGYHYSTAWGRTGMGGEDEFGLFPGQIKTSDIIELLWVKNGAVVERTDLSFVPAILDELAFLEPARAEACP